MTTKLKVAQHITPIIYKLQDAGYETYLVGGAIRDIMLGREPKDYDISTSATPEQVRAVFGKRRARIIGKRFKIVHLYHGNEIIEISTFRSIPKSESQPKMSKEETDSQILLRDNEYGTAYDDAWRRDFSVNSIFYNPKTDKLIDHTGNGLQDIKSGLVRVIGEPEVRFSEDPVRMLRALKLVGQYEFSMSKETEQALYKSLPKITQCSISRLSLELEKILRSAYSDKILKTFHDYGFLEYFLPHVNKEWDNVATKEVLALLSNHCKRFKEEKCPDYLSGVMALITVPFVNQYFNDNPSDCYWKLYAGIDKEIKRIMNYTLYPHSFPKYITSATIDAILLQQRFYSKIKSPKTRNHPHFKIALEVCIDINELWWKEKGLIKYWTKFKNKNK